MGIGGRRLIDLSGAHGLSAMLLRAATEVRGAGRSIGDVLDRVGVTSAATRRLIHVATSFEEWSTDLDGREREFDLSVSPGPTHVSFEPSIAVAPAGRFHIDPDDPAHWIFYPDDQSTLGLWQARRFLAGHFTWIEGSPQTGVAGYDAWVDAPLKKTAGYEHIGIEWSDDSTYAYDSWLNAPDAPVGAAAFDPWYQLTSACDMSLCYVATLAAGARTLRTSLTASRIDDLLSHLQPGRSIGVYVADSADDLTRLFAELARGGLPVDAHTYRGSMMLLPDGTTVGLRVTSRTGGPTIDVAHAGANVKVHVR